MIFVITDFDIGENQAAIVLSQHEVRPNPNVDVKWDDSNVDRVSTIFFFLNVKG